MSIPLPEMPPPREPHEVLLSFRAAVTAERFTDWLESAGWQAFTSWHDGMRHDIEHHDGGPD